MLGMTLSIALNTLATEVFRDQADKDYISARSCYRMNLREQFLWAAVQACEKYLKGTLLFNGRSARYDCHGQKKNSEFGHDVSRLFVAVKSIGDLPVDKPDWLPDFLKYLTKYGNNRYLSKPTYAFGDELRKLDEAVWVLRRVCQNFDWTPQNVNLRPLLLAEVGNPKNRKNPALYRPFGPIDGFLEKTLRAPSTDAARRSLIWNNMFFGRRQRHEVGYRRFSSSENPPQTREWFNKPTIVGNIEHYIKLS